MFTEDQLDAQQKTRATYRAHEGAKAHNSLQLSAQLARIRTDLSGYQVALDVAELVKLSGTIAGLAVHGCNHGLSEQQEKRAEKLSAQIKIIAGFYGLTASCGGDPRGYTVHIDGPGIKSNGWGDGFGIA
jgi:hypothetical protein